MPGAKVRGTRNACLKTSSSERAKLVRLKAWLASTVRDGHEAGMIILCCTSYGHSLSLVFSSQEKPQQECGKHVTMVWNRLGSGRGCKDSHL